MGSTIRRCAICGDELGDSSLCEECAIFATKDVEVKRDALQDRNRVLEDAVHDLRFGALRVMAATRETSGCKWMPTPDVDTDDWNPMAHIQLTLQVADLRRFKRGLEALGVTFTATQDQVVAKTELNP